MSTKLAGWEHFARAEWTAARDAFAAVLEDRPGDPEALDGPISAARPRSAS
jgi:hypothetical protein